MKCLVTGGAGLIGSHIVDKMLSLGHDVVILDNLHPQTHPEGKPNWIPKEAKFIQGDVNNYDDLSLEELTKEANKMIEDLENQKNLENSIENYQNLLKLNNIIEKKFQKDVKNINKKTQENILKITSKKNAKKTQ